jgi:hypothetical protein
MACLASGKPSRESAAHIQCMPPNPRMQPTGRMGAELQELVKNGQEHDLPLV